MKRNLYCIGFSKTRRLKETTPRGTMEALSLLVDISEERMFSELDESRKFVPALSANAVVLTWPFQKHDSFGISTIYNDWAWRLRGHCWLNSTLVEFGILHYLLESCGDPKRTDLVHVFDASLLPTLEKGKDQSAEERYLKVEKWSSKVTVFEKEFLLFPVNVNELHWYTICFIRPTMVFKSLENDVSRVDASHDSPCIVVMDSMSGNKSSHHYRKQVSLLKDYLIWEWLTKSCTVMQIKKGYVSYGMELLKWQQIPVLVLQTPQQPNDYDCGIYTIKNMKNIIRFLPSTSLEDVSNNLVLFSSLNEYTQSDVDDERRVYCGILESLISEFFSSDSKNEFDDNTCKEVDEPLFEEHQIQILLTKDILEVVLSFLYEGTYIQEELNIIKILRQKCARFIPRERIY